MAFLKVKNRAASTLASGISDSDLALTVATGEGARFPSTYPFHITICVAGNPETNIEIVECSSRTGDVLTIVRAQEGTAAVSHAADELVGLRITAEIITRLQKQLLDDDGDTGFEVEQSADEDKIHGKVKGVEAFLLDDAGVLTLAKQSGCYVAYAGGQYLEASNALSYLLYDTESYDIQGEFDNTVKTGTASATSASHLIDTTLNPFVAGDVGSFVWNTTDNTYAIVTVYNSTSDVTLDEDIMVNGEGYKLYASRFTAKTTGLYLVGMFGQLNANSVDGKYLLIRILKNGVTASQAAYYASGANQYLSAGATVVVQLDATDYLTFGANNEAAAAKQLYPAVSTSYAFVAKIA